MKAIFTVGALEKQEDAESEPDSNFAVPAYEQLYLNLHAVSQPHRYFFFYTFERMNMLVMSIYFGAVAYAMPQLLKLLHLHPVEMITSRVPSLLAEVFEAGGILLIRNKKTACEQCQRLSLAFEETAAGVANIVVDAFLNYLEHYNTGKVSIRGNQSSPSWTDLMFQDFWDVN